MSQDWYADVQKFHEAMCQDQIGQFPAAPSNKVADLRIAMMDEELSETSEAIYAGNLVGVADGLADLIYVAVGTAIAYGIDLRPVWDEVQRSNMAKLGGGRRADGKHLKPPGWKPPDIAMILDQQTQRYRMRAEQAARPVCSGHGGQHAESPRKCCDRAGEYNGFGSDGPLEFHCPESCSCHD